jgi:hypothetical protein
MVDDVEEHKDTKKLYLQTMLDAEEEAAKTDPESACDVSLCERVIAECSKLPRPLVDRISEELSEEGLIKLLGNIEPSDGRHYYFTTCGRLTAERLRYDKSWRARRRKLMGAAKEKAAEGALAGLKRVGSYIGCIVIGAVGKTYWPSLAKWLKELVGMK